MCVCVCRCECLFLHNMLLEHTQRVHGRVSDSERGGRGVESMLQHSLFHNLYSSFSRVLRRLGPFGSN